MDGAAPTPGEPGAGEATLIGRLSGAGVDPAVATPAVLVFRLAARGSTRRWPIPAVLVFRPAAYWAVVVPGWFALRFLRSRHAL